LKISSEKLNSNQIELKNYLEQNVIKGAKKLRGKFAPISEIVANIQKTLAIETIFDLKPHLKDFFLISVKNDAKQPKNRYFLAIQLASQSSDFLVALSRDFALKHDLKLIQYSIYPKSLRLMLLSLKEIKKIEEYQKGITILGDIKVKFRNRLGRIINLVESE